MKIDQTLKGHTESGIIDPGLEKPNQKRSLRKPLFPPSPLSPLDLNSLHATHLEIAVDNLFLVAVIQRLGHVEHVPRTSFFVKPAPAKLLVQLAPRRKLENEVDSAVVVEVSEQSQNVTVPAPGINTQRGGCTVSRGRNERQGLNEWSLHLYNKGARGNGPPVGGMAARDGAGRGGGQVRKTNDRVKFDESRLGSLI